MVELFDVDFYVLAIVIVAIVSVATVAFSGTGETDLGLANPDNSSDVFNALGPTVFGDSGIVLFPDPDGVRSGKAMALVTWKGEIRQFKVLECPRVDYTYLELENPRRYSITFVHGGRHSTYIGRWPKCPLKMTIDASLNLVDK